MHLFHCVCGIRHPPNNPTLPALMPLTCVSFARGQRASRSFHVTEVKPPFVAFCVYVTDSIASTALPKRGWAKRAGAVMHGEIHARRDVMHGEWNAGILHALAFMKKRERCPTAECARPAVC